MKFLPSLTVRDTTDDSPCFECPDYVKKKRSILSSWRRCRCTYHSNEHKRFRGLAVPLEMKSKSTNPQSQSPFLSLPWELRQIIFEYVFGGTAFRLCEDFTCTARSEVKFRYCSRKYRAADHYTLGALRKSKNCPGYMDLEWRSNKHLLGVPLSCKRNYFEAAGLLYSRNQFISTRSGIVAALPKVIQPSLLAQIKYLAAMLPFHRPPLQEPVSRSAFLLWVDIWQGLAALTGIETLRVWISVVHAEGWAEQEEAAFTNIRAITAPRQFDLHVPYTGKLCQVDDMPCRVHRIPGNDGLD